MQVITVFIVLIFLGWSGSVTQTALAQAHPPKVANAHAVVATVDGETIFLAEFNSAVARAARIKFYHGKIPENKISELKRDVIERLIVRRLLLKEAQARGLKGDAAAVNKKIAAVDKKNAKNEAWQKSKDRMLPLIRQRLLNSTILGLLEVKVRDVEPPTKDRLKTYYNNNAKKFTEPQREQVSVILLTVDPGLPPPAWEKAKEEAERIAKRIAAGTAFGDLAKLHSSDDSASSGGDLGYLHRGMLSEPAQKAVDKLKSGELSKPVRLLQGYGLFHLTDRQAPVLKPFTDVRERVTEFYLRDTALQQWVTLRANLRKNADIFIDPTIVPEKTVSKEPSTEKKAPQK